MSESECYNYEIEEFDNYVMLIRSIVLLQCMSEINTYLKYVHQFRLP